MGKSIWLLNRQYRLDVFKYAERQYLANLTRVADNGSIAMGRGYDAQTAASDLYDGLTDAGLDELAEALNDDAVKAELFD